MISTTDLASALKTRLSGTFDSVGFMLESSPAKAASGKSIPRGLALPCVLILAADGAYTDSTLNRIQRFHLVLIDALKGRMDERAEAAWSRFDSLQALFPPDGAAVDGITFLPESFRILECTDARAASCLTVTASVPTEN